MGTEKGSGTMVVSCPKCGQQLRSEPGESGTCPKCKTRIVFPQGDSMLGEPISCPHCGQNQRYKDGKCINCGKMLDGKEEPKTSKQKKNKSYLACVIVICAIGVFFVCSNIIESNKGNYSLDSNYSHDYDYETDFGDDIGDIGTSYSSSSSYVSDDYKLALFTLAKEEVRNQLKSPSTAVFPDSYTGSDVVYSRDGTTYGMISWVEAENSYGATVRENFTLFCTISGGDISDVTCIIGIPE